MFGVERIPKDSQLRDILDRVESEHLRPVFNDLFSRLRRGKHLDGFQLLPDHYICAIDGVYHHSSEKVHCEKCLSKTHKNGSITYSHGVLQGAFMHPDQKQIIPVMPEVNYIYYELCNEKGKVTYRNSWVTDIKVTKENVEKLVEGGRCRWKIENECFNTLKNQGYCLEHNFGHGKYNLSHNMYLLTLLAFFFHQIFELSDPAYQLCRKKYVAKRHLWETFRLLLHFFVFDSWNDVMIKTMDEREDIILLLKE